MDFLSLRPELECEELHRTFKQAKCWLCVKEMLVNKKEQTSEGSEQLFKAGRILREPWPTGDFLSKDWTAVEADKAIKYGCIT